MKKIDSVCVFIMTDYGTSNGKGLEAKSIYEGLNKLGIKVDCFVRDSKKNPEAQNVNIGGNIPYRLMTIIERYFLRSLKARYWQERMFDFFSAKKLLQVAKTQNPIVYIIPRMERTCQVARELGLKIIMHGVELPGGYNKKVLTKLYNEEKEFPNIWNLDLIELSERTQQYADYVIAHTEFSRQCYADFGIPIQKIYLTPMGFSGAHHLANKKSLPVGRIKFLYVGNITKAKGVVELLKAWHLIQDKNGELHLCGIVQEDVKHTLQMSMKESSNIYYHGFTNPAPFYSYCDVFIFPSYLESFGKVMVEAGANGLPILCNRTIAVGNFSGTSPCGRIFDSENIQSIAEAMDFYIQNPHLIIEHGMNAEEYYSQLTWEKFGDETAKIIKNIISLES